MIILDGFGVAPPNRANAITMAKTPVVNNLIAEYPTMTLHAAGETVGLPWAEMGNSEVGHMNIGTGRVVYQNLPLINHEILEKKFFQNKAFLHAIENAKKYNASLHLMGLVSNGGVHSHQEHLYALLDLCKQQNFKNVLIHAFLDGRDTPHDAAPHFIEQLENKIAEIGVGKIVSLCGRYYAMDRDNRWDRIAKAYLAIGEGTAPQTFATPQAAIAASYAAKIYDEEFVPAVIKAADAPAHAMQEHDSIIFFNFRPDRARQLTKALVLPGFDKFKRPRELEGLYMVTMTEYEKDLPVIIAYSSSNIKNCLASVLSEAGLKQLHIAETEKYAHVTFFFNGRREREFPGEKRILIPSPDVAAYNEKPAMAAYEMTERVVQEVSSGQYSFTVINYANPDMVGHTGDLDKTVEAIEDIDKAIGRVVQTVLAMSGTVVITADHGNAEEMFDADAGVILKKHTANPVPLILINQQWHQDAATRSGRGETTYTTQSLHEAVPKGVLADVAPTILKIMGVPIPEDMTGTPLI